MSDQPKLLQLIDALVRAAPGHAGVDATVCIGVRTERSFVWWRGQLGKQAATRFDSVPDIGADVLVMLDHREADALLRAGSLPAGRRMRISGDPEIFRTFASRYLASMSSIDVRSWAA